jgi:hypothetical protein
LKNWTEWNGKSSDNFSKLQIEKIEWNATENQPTTL